MTPEDRLDKAGSRLAVDTLNLYARYAELMAMQEKALDDGDLKGFESLDQELRDVQHRIGLPASTADGLPGGSQPEPMPSGALESLRKAQATHARIQDRLVALREETGSELRQLVRGSSQARRYLEASTSSETDDTPHFDVTL